MTADVEFLPVILSERPTGWDTLPMPEAAAPYMRVTRAAHVAPGDIVMGSAGFGAGNRLVDIGHLCGPYFAEPTAHDARFCRTCTHAANIADHPEPAPDAPAHVHDYYAECLQWRQEADRHRALIDFAPAAPWNPGELVVIIPAVFGEAPAVAEFRATVEEFRS